jgi:hypothetical protein
VRIECPSGLVIEARPWSLGDMGEMAIRASQSNQGDDLILDAVARQHASTVDPGPYAWIQAGDAHFAWTNVLKVDVLWSLYRLRAGSFPDDPEHGLTGEDYTYPFRCTNTECDGHKTESVQRVRLCDLKMRKLPASSAVVMQSGASFETKVACRVVKYVLPTFAIDAPLREYLKKERKTSGNPRRPVTPAEQIAAQVTFIEGVKNSDRDIGARAKWLGALEAFQWVPFRDTLTAAAPIIGNKTDATCDSCGRVTTIGLPLAPTFFAPPDRSEALLDEAGAEEEKEEKEETTTDTSVTPATTEATTPSA